MRIFIKTLNNQETSDKLYRSSIIVPSEKDKTIDLYFGVANNKYIMVVVNRETNNLITIRKMRKNEKTVFNKEILNGKIQD